MLIELFTIVFFFFSGSWCAAGGVRFQATSQLTLLSIKCKCSTFFRRHACKIALTTSFGILSKPRALILSWEILNIPAENSDFRKLSGKFPQSTLAKFREIFDGKMMLVRFQRNLQSERFTEMRSSRVSPSNCKVQVGSGATAFQSCRF